jgi:phosphatidate phosphatase PAH1
MRIAVVGLSVAIACGGPPHVANESLPVLVAPVPPRAGDVPDVRCGAPPKGLPIEGFHHRGSRLAAALGSPAHHGDDLIALADEDQRITGAIAYSVARKALENEDVTVFACEDAASWRQVGEGHTDGDGHFAVVLAGDHRLEAGLRDLYVRVAGDGTGVAFVALVAPELAKLVIVDIDGTLTTSEHAFPRSVVLHGAVDAQPYAAAALAHAPAQVVYVTARGEHFSNVTHHWLAAHGFPRGPVRLAPGWFAKPGPAALAAKTHVLGELARRFTLVAGVGNRASDVAAYAAAGIPPPSIFVKLPEFEQELAPIIAAHGAVGFTSYAQLTFGRAGGR